MRIKSGNDYLNIHFQRPNVIKIRISINFNEPEIGRKIVLNMYKIGKNIIAKWRQNKLLSDQ